MNPSQRRIFAEIGHVLIKPRAGHLLLVLRDDLAARGLADRRLFRPLLDGVEVGLVIPWAGIVILIRGSLLAEEAVLGALFAEALEGLVEARTWSQRAGSTVTAARGADLARRVPLLHEVRDWIVLPGAGADLQT